MKKKYRSLLSILFACTAIANFNYAVADDSVFFATDPTGNSRPTSLPNRSTQTSGDEFVVWVDGCKDVKFDEAERHSRIYNDIKAVVDKIRGAAAAPVACGYKEHRYTLKNDRALLKLTAIDVATGKEGSTMTVVTGPEEHLYLSLDLPVNSRKSLKYDAASKSLVPADTNPQLYLSFNYYLGDIAATQESNNTDYKKQTWWQFFSNRFSLKGSVLATSRPLDSYGLGLSFQPYWGNTDKAGNTSVALSSLSIFAGRYWIKQDAISATGVGLPNQSTLGTWRAGISYDLGTALGWIK